MKPRATAPARLRRLVAGAFLALMAVAPAAAEPVPVRAGVHKEFGRLVFDWPGKVGFTATVNNRILTVGFDRPIEPAYDGVLGALRPYLNSIRLASDGRTVLVGLTRDFQVKASNVGPKVVVDLLNDGKTPAAKPPAAKRAAVRPQPSEPASAPPTRLGPRPEASRKAIAGGTGEAKAGVGDTASTALAVRTGHHRDYGRLVFGWPRKVGFTVDRHGQAVTIKFNAPAAVDIAALRRELPSQINAALTRPTSAGLEIGLVIPPEAQLRYFHHNTAVVFDVVAPAKEVQPKARTASAEEAVAREAAKARASTANTVKKKKAERPPALPFVSVEAERKGADLVFKFNWRQPVAAAMFRRDATLWIVFDRPARIDLGPIQVFGGGVFRKAIQQNDGGGVQVMLPASAAFEPLIRREGTVWVLEIGPGGKRPVRNLPIEIHAKAKDGPELLIKALKRGRIVPQRDPLVGDAIYAVPLSSTGYGIQPLRRFPEFELLESPQGIAIRPLDDAIRVRAAPDGVVVFKPGGLSISPDVVAATGRRQESGDSRIFDMASWRYGPAADYQKIEHDLLQYVMQPKGVRRNAARLGLARFYAAHGMGPEALGVVETLLREDPQLLRDPQIRALHGLAEYLVGHYAEAETEFSHPSLAGLQDLYPWRAGIAAAKGDWAGAARLFAGTDSVIAALPSRFAIDLGLLAVEAALSVKDREVAEARVAALGSLPAVGGQLDQLAYLKGHLLKLKGEPAKAVAQWKTVAEDGVRPARAKATFAIVNALLEAGEIEAPEAIKRLEALKFAWRNNVFEFDLLTRLGELYADRLNLRDALVTLRQAVTLYKDIKGAQTLTERMRAMFRKFYLDGEADQLEPVVALGLFNEFRELTPAGADGDRMMRRLAERLIKVDLLGEAANLLDHQVRFRLKDVERAEAGARLAEVLLADTKPQEALAALEKSHGEKTPAALMERRRHLRSAALMDAQRYDDALKEIATDFAEEFDMLRAQIYWRASRWHDTSRALARLTGVLDPATLSDRDAELLLRRAVALGLAGDRGGMQFLRERFGAAMEKSSQAASFTAVAGGKLLKAEDYAALARRAAELDTFKAFMNTLGGRSAAKNSDQTAALN